MNVVADITVTKTNIKQGSAIAVPGGLPTVLLEVE